MRECTTLSEEESERFSKYIFKRFGARSYGKKNKILHDALMEYLDREEKS